MLQLFKSAIYFVSVEYFGGILRLSLKRMKVDLFMSSSVRFCAL